MQKMQEGGNMKIFNGSHGLINLFSLLWFLGFVGIHGLIAYAIVKVCYILKIV